jgi:hypothetical protein
LKLGKQAYLFQRLADIFFKFLLPLVMAGQKPIFRGKKGAWAAGSSPAGGADLQAATIICGCFFFFQAFLLQFSFFSWKKGRLLSYK